MNNKISKKKIMAQYKERKIIGGIYIIKNTKNGQIFLESTVDLQGRKNRFEFSQKTGSCVNMKLQEDWSKFGSSAFTFETLEEIEKNETQTDDEFRADIELLKKVWIEKLQKEHLY